MNQTQRARLVLALAALIGAGVAQAQIKVGVIYSSSGPIAAVGLPQRNTVALLPREVAGQRIDYIAVDDASDPTASVTAAKKLISENQVDALIGPSGSPNAMGVIQFVAEAGVPMFAPVGSAAVILPMNEQKKWVFKTTQNDDLIARALIGHMRANGVKTLAIIGTADPYGENWTKVVTELLKGTGITLTGTESFQRRDTSLTAQGLKTMARRPDAVLIAAPGSSAVLPQTTLFDQGYKGRVYQTHGAAMDDFLVLGGKKVEGTVLAASGMLVLDDMAASNPVKAVALRYVADYQKAHNAKPATFGANVYDAGLLLQAAIPAALKKGKPGTPAFRSALRDAIEQTKELPGTQGVYNMTAQDHSGFDDRGRELITVQGGRWVPLK